MNTINELQDIEDQKKMRKCLKSYLTAKKYYENDIEKSYEYFKQCIKILNDLKDKDKKLNNEFVNIIEETENECSKYLTLAIESTIEKPSKRKIKVDEEQDNKLFEIIQNVLYFNYSAN